MSITAASVNQNAKTRRSNWGTFFWRIQICNKKWGFPFQFLIFPPPPPPGGGGGGSSLVSLDVPLRDEQLSLPTFFYPMHSSRDISMSSDKWPTLYILYKIYVTVYAVCFKTLYQFNEL